VAAHIPGPLYVAQTGATGIPMLFAHSTPDDHRIWLYQTAHFSSWFRCLAVDLAGYGRSPAVQSGVTVGDQAAACWEEIDKVSTGGAVLHGNSLGGRVVMEMAVQQPKRTLALILSGIGYTPGGGGEVMKRWMERYTAEGLPLRHFQVLDHFSDKGKKDPFLLHYADMVCALNNEGTLASIIAMNEALSHGTPPNLHQNIRSPTLVISGTEDRSYATVRNILTVIKNCELQIVEGAGHAVMIEAPWAYDRHCVEFLAKLGLFPGPVEKAKTPVPA
jgi:pimeloyl-ACP methyl ester carboxylesterase